MSLRVCPVARCGTVIPAGMFLCHPDWMRLPPWARGDLMDLRKREPASDLTRRTEAVAVAYLNELVLTGRIEAAS